MVRRGGFLRSVSLAFLAPLGACAGPTVEVVDASPSAPAEATSGATPSATAGRSSAKLEAAAPLDRDDDILLAVRRGGSFDASSFLATGIASPVPPSVLADLAAPATPLAKRGLSLTEPPEAPDPALADDPRCPQGMQLVEGESCWDVRHECTDPMPNDPAGRCRSYKKGADECVPPKKDLKFCMDRYEWPGVPGAKPRVIVTYYEAERLCKSIGKRMCEEQEFYLACEGPEHWPFAWGHERYPSTCNIDRPWASVDWGKWSTDPYEEAERLDQALPIGTSKCWSPYGIHDIAGNVDEWTHARQGRDLLGSLNGGYWGPVANACRYVTTVHGPEFAFYQIGFRCCADAKE